MKDFLGTLWHTISDVNPDIIVFGAFNLVFIIVLNILHRKLKKDKKKLAVWHWLCIVPLIISIIHYLVFYLGTMFNETLIFLYVPSILAAIWSLSGNKKIIYGVLTAVVDTAAVLGCIICTVYGTYQCGNFTRMSYTESFKATIEEMKKNYVLTAWKETDFNAIEAEILPEVEEAENNNDAAAFADALARFRYMMHDGHVGMYILDDKVRNEFTRQYTGNDYGFSMITIDNGDTIAVVTDTQSDAYAAGIHDGTKIIKWDHVPVEEAKETVEYTASRSIPVASNEEFMKPVFLAGSGGDNVCVTFIKDDGKEETVTLKKTGSYYHRYNTVTSKLFSKDKTDCENYSCKMLSKTCGYMLVNQEHFNSYDIIAYTTGNHKPVRKMFLEKLDSLKAQGMETLVIDLRNNAGGYDDVSTGWASLFADKKYYAFSLGSKKQGGNKRLCDHYILESGEYSYLKVAVLVNMNCISAGDGTAFYLSKLPNVTVLGMTDPNGSNQETGGSCYVSDGIAVIDYPLGLVTDENGNPNIDVAADRISRNPADIHIPLTYDGAMQIFNGEGDYELEYAVDYLEGK